MGQSYRNQQATALFTHLFQSGECVETRVGKKDHHPRLGLHNYWALYMTLLALFANPITYHQGPTAGRGSSCRPATPGCRTNTTCREPPSEVSGTISPWPGRKHFRSETNTSSLHYLSRLWQHLTVLANSHPLRGGGGCVGGGEEGERRKRSEVKYIFHEIGVSYQMERYFQYDLSVRS